MPEIKLYNTLTRKEEEFNPHDPNHVKFYACGPTVYDRAHIGNGRMAVMYDVLFRLMKRMYPQVTYVRNITDVDDKINAAAKAKDEPISALTQRVTNWFHEDMDALGVLRPTVEPRATWFVNETGEPPEVTPHKKDHMVAMIQRLIKKEHAYPVEAGEGKGHVLFDVASDPHYGCLSGRTREDQQAGARIAVESYKKNPGDFVLWKPANPGDDPSSVFSSPWGNGRPGWHIECSVMSTNYLGDTFDIHGGGADLMFPHHENEIAQSTCATGGQFAKYWVHNGFLTVNGEKMSKSLGNFITVRDLLDKGVKGEVIRYALLSTHYRKPLDWTDKLLEDAEKALNKFYKVLEEYEGDINDYNFKRIPFEFKDVPLPEEFKQILSNDLNMPAALSYLHAQVINIHKATNDKLHQKHILVACGRELGLLQQNPYEWRKSPEKFKAYLQEINAALDNDHIKQQIQRRIAAKKSRDFATADRIRDELKAEGVLLEDRPDGTTEWRQA